jgi:hypothetical protein
LILAVDVPLGNVKLVVRYSAYVVALFELINGRPIEPAYPGSTIVVHPVNPVFNPFRHEAEPLSNTNVSLFAGAVPSDQFVAALKNVGPVATVVLDIVKVAAPLVDTLTMTGFPAVAAVIANEVYGPPIGNAAYVNSVNSTGGTGLTAERLVCKPNKIVDTVSEDPATNVMFFALIVTVYVWLTTVPDSETVQTSETAAALPSHLLIAIINLSHEQKKTTVSRFGICTTS